MKSKMFLLAIILLGFIMSFLTFVTSITDTPMNLISLNIQKDDFGIDWTLKEIFSYEAISFRDYYGKVLVIDLF